MDSAYAAPRGYRIGYGRMSTRDQNPDSQRDALEGRHVRDHSAVSRDAVAEASHRPVRRPY
jgi:DNA invertase Pin-like site-specific DNA recombinase